MRKNARSSNETYNLIGSAPSRDLVAMVTYSDIFTHSYILELTVDPIVVLKVCV